MSPADERRSEQEVELDDQLDDELDDELDLPEDCGYGDADGDDYGDADPVAAEAPLAAVDLAAALAQRDEYLVLARQVQADFENFRKRALKQQTDQAQAAMSRLAEALLPVLDACDSAVIHGVEGIGPVHKALLEVLGRAGLEVVPTEDGTPFDPTVHDAVLHEPGDGVEASIVEVLRTGYLWHGRTLRAAMVKVRD